ncbi:hypothetical protein ABEH06_12945 [Pantoea agglomerans]|uniref:hypothetical protein n=1 Tax=Enterobacter agglomerans TaxID=549 RepID=UPI003208E41E
MKKVNGGLMANTRVPLDNTLYDGVTFRNCTMVYTGEGGDMGLQNCILENCSWEFNGAAANTLNFLEGLSKGMGPSGKDLVRKLLTNVLDDL